MPLYDYDCRRHGPFREWAEMSHSDRPARCPDCAAPAPRLMAAPRLGIDSTLRKAHTINETSANEPRVVHRRRGDPMTHDTHRDLTEARGRRVGRAKTHRSNHPWAVREH
jgi:putative FmdB family regulatory protein